MVTALNSATATQGQQIDAVVSRPFFSGDHKLILPEGTHITGAVTLVHPAGWFHRGGQLRFNFQTIEAPPNVVVPQPSDEPPAARAARTPGILAAAEPAKSAIKVDEEGGIRATESKTRFVAPAIAALIAAKSLDNDSGRTGTSDPNVSGRTLGGLSGFGLVGSLVAQASHTIGSALGFYGMAWSVYSNIVARGSEIEVGHNAVVEIRYGSRAPAPSSKFVSAETR
jgi:hypothetical protein